MKRKFVQLCLIVTLTGCATGGQVSDPTAAAAGQQVSPNGLSALPAAALTNDVQLAAIIPDIARRARLDYVEPNRSRYLNNLLRLQIVSGEPMAALETARELRRLSSPTASLALADPAQFVYALYTTALAESFERGLAFDVIYPQTFRQALGQLSDLEVAEITYWLETPGFLYDRNLRDVLNRVGEKPLSTTDAVQLVRTYLARHMFMQTAAMVPALIAEEKQRRYDITNNVLIKSPDGATLSAIVVRPRRLQGPQPAALQFIIYSHEAANRQVAEIAAAHGYIGVVADMRGKRLSPDPIEPYEHEVDDTYTVIDWISRQPWSNGQVAMYGGSYSGYATWAATKRLHPALKTIIPSVAVIPGIGLPMLNNVFLNANYGWGFYIGNNKLLDNATYQDRERWENLNRNWFASGRRYRDIDKVDGTPNPYLQRWLQHPAYDRFWQAKVPFRRDYAHINIPVLSIAGYFDDAQISSIHYVSEHYKYNPKADHYLVIGPYDHFGTQARRKQAVVNEYTVDPVAQFDTDELTFGWMDYVLKGGARPAMLKDRINYQVMGANEWRHAPSIAAMSDRSLKLYLTTERDGSGRYQLKDKKPVKSASLRSVIDFKDRTAYHNEYYPYPVQGKELGATGLSFLSEPFQTVVSVSGMFSGTLKVSINKRDFDFGVVLYEVMPDGTLFQLSYYLGRASFANDMTQRNLLTPGRVTSLPFERSMLVSRQLQKGSRLLAVVDVNFNSNHQVNYGTGRDVSDESIADAREPLVVHWGNDSVLNIPIEMRPSHATVTTY